MSSPTYTVVVDQTAANTAFMRFMRPKEEPIEGGDDTATAAFLVMALQDLAARVALPAFKAHQRSGAQADAMVRAVEVVARTTDQPSALGSGRGARAAVLQMLVKATFVDARFAAELPLGVPWETVAFVDGPAPAAPRAKGKRKPPPIDGPTFRAQLGSELPGVDVDQLLAATSMVLGTLIRTNPIGRGAFSWPSLGVFKLTPAAPARGGAPAGAPTVDVSFAPSWRAESLEGNMCPSAVAAGVAQALGSDAALVASHISCAWKSLHQLLQREHRSVTMPHVGTCTRIIAQPMKGRDPSTGEQTTVPGLDKYLFEAEPALARHATAPREP